MFLACRMASRRIGPLPSVRISVRLFEAEPVIAMGEEDRARLEGLIKNWEGAGDAGRAEAQRNLLLAVREIAKKNLGSARGAYVAGVEKLRGMLTAQQIE